MKYLSHVTMYAFRNGWSGVLMKRWRHLSQDRTKENLKIYLERLIDRQLSRSPWGRVRIAVDPLFVGMAENKI